MSGKISSENFYSSKFKINIVVKTTIMTQPELGQEIARLRKENGLTQEELVERCNINVRTIQRIEAGDVTPRSYTIKSILAAMNLDLEALKVSEAKVQFNIENKEKTYKTLVLAMVSGVLYILTMILADISYFFFEDSKFTEQTILSVLIGIELLCLLGLYYGFVNVGKITSRSLLSIGGYSIIAMGIIWYSIEIISLWFFSEWHLSILVIEGVFFGMATLILGAGIWSLRDYHQSLASITAIAEFILGGSLLSVIFQVAGVFLVVPVVILEIALLYKMQRLFKES